MAEFNFRKRPRGKGTLKYRRVWDALSHRGLVLLSVDYNGMILAEFSNGAREFIRADTLVNDPLP